MNAKRLKAIGKLAFLFGTPIAIILGLFSCGVYFGAQNRHGITSFEKDWLGLDVEVAPPHDKDGDEEKDKDNDKDPDKGEDGDKDPDDDGDKDPDKGGDKDPDDDGDEDPDDDGDKEPERGNPEPLPTPAETEKPPAPVPVVTPQPEPTPVIPSVAPPPEPKTDPLEGPLAHRLSTPVVVGVKVLVDRELMTSQPAWIDYVQRTVSQASNVYEKQFGIELRLAGVVEWPVATEGMSTEELLEDVRRRPREGTDVLVGFTSRPFDDTKAGIADQPAEDGPFNGAYGVVYATAGHRNAHLRTLLHEVAHLFGATDITDPANAAWVAGSWMSYAPTPETQAPWIDATNRARVLERKDKPFRPEPKE